MTAPSHYLNQCWLIISKLWWHSSEGNFTASISAINHCNWLEKYSSKISLKSPRPQWAKYKPCDVPSLTYAMTTKGEWPWFPERSAAAHPDSNSGSECLDWIMSASASWVLAAPWAAYGSPLVDWPQPGCVRRDCLWLAGRWGYYQGNPSQESPGLGHQCLGPLGGEHLGQTWLSYGRENECQSINQIQFC